MAKKDGAKSRARSERFEVEQTMSPGDVADYLEGLAQGIRNGSLAFGHDSGGFKYAIASDVDVGVAARRGKRKSRVALTLAFRTEQRGEESPVEAAAEGAPSQDLPEDTIPDEMRF
jgi:amphi-Trp domain-containing protein